MLLLAAVLVTTVTGCDAGRSPAPVLSPILTPSPTLPAPMPSPAKPALWSDNAEQGAGSAAVWFLTGLYPYVRETNDTVEWQALSTPECEFCRTTVEDATADAAAGQVVRGEHVEVTVTRVEELNPLAYSVLADVDQPSADVLRLDGTKVSQTEVSRGQVLLVLRREGPNWLLREGQFFEAGAVVPTARAGA